MDITEPRIYPVDNNEKLNALANVTFVKDKTLYKKSFYIIAGPNGTGKTNFCHVISA